MAVELGEVLDMGWKKGPTVKKSTSWSFPLLAERWGCEDSFSDRRIVS